MFRRYMVFLAVVVVMTSGHLDAPRRQQANDTQHEERRDKSRTVPTPTQKRSPCGKNHCHCRKEPLCLMTDQKPQPQRAEGRRKKSTHRAMDGANTASHGAKPVDQLIVKQTISHFFHDASSL
jgi:hypothetical protein